MIVSVPDTTVLQSIEEAERESPTLTHKAVIGESIETGGLILTRN